MEKTDPEDGEYHESKEECMKRLDNATKEWDEVQEIVPSFANETNNFPLQNMPSRNVKDTALISVAQVIQDFRNQDLTIQKKEAKVRKMDTYNYSMYSNCNLNGT